MAHDLSVALLGELPDYSCWLYSALDLILVILIICVLLSPFVLIFKVLGGK